MGQYVYLVFAFFALAMIVYTKAMVPETRGRSLENMAALFK